MNKRIQEREQKPECAIQRLKCENEVTEGRRELADLIGRLLVRRWLKGQCLPESSNSSTSFDENGELR